MKQAYAPALQVAAQTRVRKLRELPLPGRALVEVGQKVDATTDVLAAELPGELQIVRVADRIGFDVEDVVKAMQVKVGAEVRRGDLLCEIKSLFGLLTSRTTSPADGTIEFFTESNAHLGIREPSVPLTVGAYVAGTVVEIEEGLSVTIETHGAMVQGIFGVGGERHGEVLALPADPAVRIEPGVLAALGDSVRGKILVGGSSYSIEALHKAGELGAAAVMCGSIDAETLHAYVGHEIGVSITGDEDVPFTLIITEGFGELPISRRVIELCKTLEGRAASVNGATQVRAGATRPELIVPHSEGADDGSRDDLNVLEIGARLRIVRVPYFGQFGTITELPSEPREIPTGAVVRVLKARLDSGEEVIVPRANIELI